MLIAVLITNDNGRYFIQYSKQRELPSIDENSRIRPLVVRRVLINCKLSELCRWGFRTYVDINMTYINTPMLPVHVTQDFDVLAEYSWRR